MSIFQSQQKSIEEIPITNEEIGEKIRDLIKKKKKSLGMVAELTGITRPTLNKVLYGDFDTVSFGTIKEILDYLEVDFAIFMGLPSHKEYARMLSEHREQEKQTAAMIEDFSKLMDRYKSLLGRKSNATVNVTAEHTNDFIMHKLQSTYTIDYVNQGGLYPTHTPTGESAGFIHQTLNLIDIDVVIDSYDIHNDNIHIVKDNVLFPLVSHSEDYSVFEHLNNGGNMENLEKTYKALRYCMGILGALDSIEFYILNYLCGYFNSTARYLNELASD